MTDYLKLWRSLSPAQRIACAECCARQWRHNATAMEKAIDAHAAGKYWHGFVDAGVHSTDTTYMVPTRAKPKTVAKLVERGLTSAGYNGVRYTREMGELIAWVVSHDSVKWLCTRNHDEPGTSAQIHEVYALGLTKRPTEWQVENGYKGSSEERDWKLHGALRDAGPALKRARDQAQIQAVAKIDADQKKATREARAAVEKAERDAAKLEHIERARRWAEGLVPSDDPAVSDLVEAYVELVSKHVGPVEDEEAA